MRVVTSTVCDDKDVRSLLDATTRTTVARLARAGAGGVVSLDGAVKALGLPRSVVAARLARMVRAGWLSRAQRGLYFVRPLEQEPHTQAVPDDPWLLAHALFAPCYVGGWTAAEHWGLTDQIFRATFVVTGAPKRRATETRLATEFRVVRVPASRVATVGETWRGRERVRVSSPARTIADALDHPEWLGGIRHFVEVLTAAHERDPQILRGVLAELETLGRGAAFKRLGFITERLWPTEVDVIAGCLARRTKGVIGLDPAVRAVGRIVSRWGLRANVQVGEAR